MEIVCKMGILAVWNRELSMKTWHGSKSLWLLLIFLLWFYMPNCTNTSRPKLADTLPLKCVDSSCKQYI